MKAEAISDAEELIAEAHHQAQTALADLERAASYRDARRHWGEYVLAWVRTLNRIDTLAKRLNRRQWREIDPQVRADADLVYLKKARNETDHGITQVVAREPDRLQIGGGSYNGYIQSIVVGPGFIHVQHEPLQASLVVTPVSYHPENIRLLDIHDRDGSFPAPRGPAYQFAKPSPPVVLGRKGLDFIAARLADLQALPRA